MHNIAGHLISICISLLLSGQLSAAGGVVGEAGSCIIKIGFYTAHFTVYQPQSATNDEFCEDLPHAETTLFVLDYLHPSLKEVPVSFRIIKDLQGFGEFAKLESIQQIKDIADQTVFFEPAAIYKDARMAIEYKFNEPGHYIGLVTAAHPTKDFHYQAIFPFKVGSTGYGYWPLIIILAAILQLQFMFNQRNFSRWFTRWLKRE